MSDASKELTDWQVTTFDILRHGETEGGKIFRGATDVALIPEGFANMERNAARLADISMQSDYSPQVPDSPWERVITSPLIRCRQFAEKLCEEQGLPLHVEDNFRETSFGDWDGVPFSEIKSYALDAFNNFWRDPVNNTPPGGEPFSTFCQRVQTGLQEAVKAFRGQHILLVTHGGVIRALLNAVVEGDAMSFMRFEVPYACISRIRVYHDESRDFFQVYFHNR